MLAAVELMLVSTTFASLAGLRLSAAPPSSVRGFSYQCLPLSVLVGGGLSGTCVDLGCCGKQLVVALLGYGKWVFSGLSLLSYL